MRSRTNDVLRFLGADMLCCLKYALLIVSVYLSDTSIAECFVLVVICLFEACPIIGHDDDDDNDKRAITATKYLAD